MMAGNSVPQTSTVTQTGLDDTVVTPLMDSLTEVCQIIYLGDEKGSLTTGDPALSVFWEVHSVSVFVTSPWRVSSCWQFLP